jgi:hypothetical protein
VFRIGVPGVGGPLGSDPTGAGYPPRSIAEGSGALVVTATADSTVWDSGDHHAVPGRPDRDQYDGDGFGRLTDVHLLGGRRTPRGFLYPAVRTSGGRSPRIPTSTTSMHPFVTGGFSLRLDYEGQTAVAGPGGHHSHSPPRSTTTGSSPGLMLRASFRRLSWSTTNGKPHTPPADRTLRSGRI